MQGKVTCSDCGKDFASPRSLANHKNRFHNDKKDSDNESEDSQSTSVTNEDGDIFSQHDDKVSDTDTDISKVSESSRDDHSLNGNVDSNSIETASEQSYREESANDMNSSDGTDNETECEMQYNTNRMNSTKLSKLAFANNPLSLVYSLKKYFAISGARETLNLTSSEDFLVDCILNVSSLRETADVVKENRKDLAGIFRKIRKYCKK